MVESQGLSRPQTITKKAPTPVVKAASAEDKSKPRTAKKEAERPPSIWKKLQDVLIVDVNLLPDRWMSLA